MPKTRPLTDLQVRALRDLDTRHTGGVWTGIATSRRLPLARVRSLIRRGLAEHVGRIVMTDGDGFTEFNADGSERERDYYALTERGREIVDAMDGVALEHDA